MVFFKSLSYMMEDAIDLIATQCGLDDSQHENIKQVLADNKNDVVKTIMVLCNIKECPDKNKPTPSIFDDIRMIVSEKEQLFFQRKATT